MHLHRRPPLHHHHKHLNHQLLNKYSSTRYNKYNVPHCYTNKMRMSNYYQPRLLHYHIIHRDNPTKTIKVLGQNQDKVISGHYNTRLTIMTVTHMMTCDKDNLTIIFCVKVLLEASKNKNKSNNNIVTNNDTLISIKLMKGKFMKISPVIVKLTLLTSKAISFLKTVSTILLTIVNKKVKISQILKSNFLTSRTHRWLQILLLDMKIRKQIII